MAGNDEDGDLRVAVAAALRSLRSQRGLTQADAAKSLGIRSATLSTWENGTREPKISQLRAAAELYGSSLDELIALVVKLDAARVARP